MKSLEEIIKSINASHKTLYVLCGLPYSGKTHIAHEILKHTSCAYVSMDTILKELGYDWDSNTLPDGKGWDKVTDLSYQESQKALTDSRNVLYDSTNHAKMSRDALRNIAREVGGQTKIIYIDVPATVIRKRWEENKVSKKRFVLDEKLLDMTVEALEVPGSDENPWILKNHPSNTALMLD